MTIMRGLAGAVPHCAQAQTTITGDVLSEGLPPACALNNSGEVMREVIFTLLPAGDSDPAWFKCSLCGLEVKENELDIHSRDHGAEITTVKYRMD